MNVSSKTKMKPYKKRPRGERQNIDVSKISPAKSHMAAREARKKGKLLAKKVGADPGGPRSMTMPCVPKRTWIVDSGSCFDLVGDETL